VHDRDRQFGGPDGGQDAARPLRRRVRPRAQSRALREQGIRAATPVNTIMNAAVLVLCAPPRPLSDRGAQVTQREVKPR